jgi:hypothetical protein
MVGANDLDWRKSSFSFSNGNCTEVATFDGFVGIRDSKDPEGPALFFAADAWREFAASLKAGTLET